MIERKFLDCDGDTWTEYEPGMLRLTDTTSAFARGTTSSIEDAKEGYGPLTEVHPDVRALLAGVLEDMAEDVRNLACTGDAVADGIGHHMGWVFADKARQLREESA